MSNLKCTANAPETMKIPKLLTNTDNLMNTKNCEDFIIWIQNKLVHV